MIIHLAASIVSLKEGLLSVTGIKEIDQLAVSKSSSSFRWGQFQHSQACVEVLGEPANNDSLTVAEWRSHANDILMPNHDRDYKSLICYPVKRLDDVNVLIIRVSPSCNFATHVIRSSAGSKKWAHLISFQDHMRLLIPVGVVDRGGFMTPLQPQSTI